MPSRLCALGADDTTELEHVRGFFRQYAAWLGVDLSFQGFADEIANLPGAYGAADGRLFYAEVDGQPGRLRGHPPLLRGRVRDEAALRRSRLRAAAAWGASSRSPRSRRRTCSATAASCSTPSRRCGSR